MFDSVSLLMVGSYIGVYVICMIILKVYADRYLDDD